MSNELESFKVWQKSMDFVVETYKEIIPLLPAEEKYGLVSQLRRALISVPANIAEGHGRYYDKERIRYCLIARGSLEEVITYLHLCVRLDYIPNETMKDYLLKLKEIRKLINSYIDYLQKNTDPQQSAIKETGDSANNRAEAEFASFLNSSPEWQTPDHS